MWALPLKKQFLFLNRHKDTLSGSLHNLSLMMTIVLPNISSVSSVDQSCLTLCTPWTPAHQASLFITNSLSLLKLMPIELVMPSNHLILCRSLLLPSVFPSISIFSRESVLHIRWLKYWSFSFSISPPNEYLGLISFRIDWFDLLVCYRCAI